MTTKEFVRANGIALARHLNGPYIKGIGFGEVLVLKILWTAVRNVSSEVKCREVWTGHRFDITTIDGHKQQSAREASRWTDISEEVSDEMMQLWEKEYKYRDKN